LSKEAAFKEIAKLLFADELLAASEEGKDITAGLGRRVKSKWADKCVVIIFCASFYQLTA